MVVAPTPNKTAKECVSRVSAVWTLIETKPLMPRLTNFEFIAPNARIVGIGALFSLIFLSLKTKCLYPSRTAVSASEHNWSNFFFKLL